MINRRRAEDLLAQKPIEATDDFILVFCRHLVFRCPFCQSELQNFNPDTAHSCPNGECGTRYTLSAHGDGTSDTLDLIEAFTGEELILLPIDFNQRFDSATVDFDEDFHIIFLKTKNQ